MENMVLNKTQLKVLETIIDSKAGLTSIELAEKLKITQSQMSFTLTRLIKEGLVEKKKKVYLISKFTHAQYLKNLYLEKRINLGRIFSNKRIVFLYTLLRPITVKKIQPTSNLKKSVVYQYIKEFKEFGIIKETNKSYCINTEKWQPLNDFICEYNKFKKIVDYRIPPNAQILYKDEKKLLFRYDFDFDAEKTAFSRFSEFGLKIYPVGTIYRLPKKELSVKEVYTDALQISKEYRDYMFDILFYLTHKKELINVNQKIHKDIIEHLKGNTKDYLPPLNEIKEKAKDYGLKWQ